MPVLFRVADIYKTKVCPLAKVMRRELKKRGVKKLKVVYSEEQPTQTDRRYGDQLPDTTVSARREQSISARRDEIFREVWHLYLRWQDLLLPVKW